MQDAFYGFVEFETPYLDTPADQSYEEPNFKACLQIDQSDFVITGQTTWIFDVRPKSELEDFRTNFLKDKNLFLQYYWRVAQTL